MLLIQSTGPDRYHRLRTVILLVYLISLPQFALASDQSQSAIDEAAILIKQADELGNLWRGTRAVLAQARQAEQEGRNAEALSLAGKAAAEARLAINQARLSQARYHLQRYRELGGSKLTATPQYQAAQQAVIALDGDRALELVQHLPLPHNYKDAMP